MLPLTMLICSLEAESAVELLSQRGLLHDVGHGAGYQGEGRAEWPPGAHSLTRGSGHNISVPNPGRGTSQ